MPDFFTFTKNWKDFMLASPIFLCICFLEKKITHPYYLLTWFFCFTPARTHFISGLKSRVLKFTFFSLKMMVKTGLEFILKLTEPLQRYLLTCQANSALLGRFFGTGQQQLWRGSVNFKIKSSRPLFPIILSQKSQFQNSRFSSTYKMRPSWCE